MEVVLLLTVPGRRRALVDEETAELLVRMNQAKRIDRDPDPRPVAMQPASPPRW